MIPIKRGDRVILTTIESYPSAKVPLWGSKYGCIGIAQSSVTHATSPVRVNWDNGQRSLLSAYKLTLYDTENCFNNPNLAFIKEKMMRSKH